MGCTTFEDVVTDVFSLVAFCEEFGGTPSSSFVVVALAMLAIADDERDSKVTSEETSSLKWFSIISILSGL